MRLELWTKKIGTINKAGIRRKGQGISKKILVRLRRIHYLLIPALLAINFRVFGQIPDTLFREREMAVVAPAPPTEVKAYDTRNDAGKSITIEWKLSATDVGDVAVLKGYEIYRSERPDSGFENIGFVLCGKTSYDDNSTQDGKKYYYYVRAVSPTGFADSEITGPVTSKAQWFNTDRTNILILAVLFGFLIIWYIERAKKGEKLFIRKITGLDAIDDAVGRATEMGRPILFSFGLGVITDIVTIAALSILGKIAKKSAEYQTTLLVPNYDPIVMTAAQETVKQAYMEAGRPDLYNESNIPYLTTDQFGYAAGVDGIMVREKPGAVFWQGYFFAESLILAETGHTIGAIQIAGTTAITQLPFFIAACDYTLIGEEMYAASCYLKPDPQMLGSLKGEDFAKVVTIGIIVIAAVIGTLAHFKVYTFDKIFEFLIDLFGPMRMIFGR
uniref:Fibronectin type III domain-containing protein n=1 Tax=candidate division WOR-3 bacterium TaxID=2052148 RepID=A0A7C6EBQ3_UNCW3